MNTRRIELEKVARDAQIGVASFDKATKSVEVVWSTGAVVRRRGPNGFYDEELIMDAAAVDLSRLNAGAPLLNSHNDWSLETVIGSVVPDSARIVAGKGVARVQLSDAPGDADIVRKIISGVIKNISVGYRVLRAQVVERDGDVDLWRIIGWQPLEISAVAVGADPYAQVRRRSDGEKRYTARIVTLDRSSIEATRIRMWDRHRRAVAGLGLEGETRH